MADCMADRRVRAIAEYDPEQLIAADSLMLNQLGDGAVLAITISPEEEIDIRASYLSNTQV